jgi:hypothetical protein
LLKTFFCKKIQMVIENNALILMKSTILKQGLLHKCGCLLDKKVCTVI